MPDDPTLMAPAADEADASTADDGEGTATAPPEDPTVKIIEDYRRRQAGAEKARQEAERIAKAAQAELEALRASKPAAKPSADGPDIEARMAELEAQYEKKAADAIAKVQGEALSARFPAARAKFPEITDPVKLAELEAVFGETTTQPAPVGNNPPRAQAPATKSLEDMTRAELEKHLLGMDKSVIGL